MSVDPRLTPEGLITIFLVIGGWTILWKDNPYYRFIVHLLLGTLVSYQAVVNFESIKNLTLIPISQGNLLLLIPFILGALSFAKYSKKYYYVSRFPTALMVGIATALMMRGWLDSMIIKQFATIATLFTSREPFDVVSNIVFIVAFITTLYVFIFSLPLTRPRPMTYTMKIGRWGLMAMLGLYFGATIMTRLEMTLPAMLFFLKGIRS